MIRFRHQIEVCRPSLAHIKLLLTVRGVVVWIVFCLDDKEKAICVRVYKLTLRAVLNFQVIIKKSHTSELSCLCKQACLGGTCFCARYVCASQIISKYLIPCKSRADHQTTYLVCLPTSDNLIVNMVSQVLHRSAKHCVVHQFVKATPEIAFRFLPYLRVHPDVWLHQTFLFELYRSVHLFQTLLLFEITKMHVSASAPTSCFFFGASGQLLCSSCSSSGYSRSTLSIHHFFEFSFIFTICSSAGVTHFHLKPLFAGGKLITRPLRLFASKQVII